MRALHALLERGARLKSLDVGNGFCFVQEESGGNSQRVQNSYFEAAKEAYFVAAKNWQFLIQDAVKSSPQFAVLWREHKQDCQRSPFAQALLAGSFLRATGILLLECARWPLKFRNTKYASVSRYHADDVIRKPGHPIPRDLRMDIYQSFSAEKKKMKQKIKQGSETETKVDNDDNRRDQKIVQQKSQLKHIILLEGL